jgi:hypothetical protein
MIEKVVENKARADNWRKSGIRVFPTEEILGSMQKTREFAAFSAKHREELEVIKKSLLLDFCEGMVFTPQELKCFRLGLDGLSKFFEDSEKDMESYLAMAEEKNKPKKAIG